MWQDDFNPNDFRGRGPLPEKNPRFPGNPKDRSFAVAGLGVRRAVLYRCGRDELARIVALDRIGVIASGKRKK